MKKFSTRKRLFVIWLSGLFLLGLNPVEAQPAYQGTDQTVQIETLQQGGSSWDKKPYIAYPSAPPQLTILRITIPPNHALPWHTHPMPIAAYVFQENSSSKKSQVRKKS
jgi:hypothetical protein